MAERTTAGVVRLWHQEQGWGVLDSPATGRAAFSSGLGLTFDD